MFLYLGMLKLRDIFTYGFEGTALARNNLTIVLWWFSLWILRKIAGNAELYS